MLEAASGQEALTLAQQGPDLIVLDVNLPDIDGFEVCRRLRARADTSRTPVIHLSATFTGRRRPGAPDSKGSRRLHHAPGRAAGPHRHRQRLPAHAAPRRLCGRARPSSRRCSSRRSTASCCSTTRCMLDANPAACRSFDHDCEQMVGRPLTDFVPAASIRTLVEMDHELALTRRLARRLAIMRRDGRLMPLEWSVSVNTAPNTRLARCYRHHRAHRDRGAPRTAARQRAGGPGRRRTRQPPEGRLSRRPVARARTPLNAIVGWAELLKRRIDEATRSRRAAWRRLRATPACRRSSSPICSTSRASRRAS